MKKNDANNYFMNLIKIKYQMHIKIYVVLYEKYTIISWQSNALRRNISEVELMNEYI